MATSSRWPAIIVCSAVAAVLVVVFSGPAILRVPLVLWFVGVCPGMAWVRMLRLKDTLTVWVVAVTLSLGVATLASVALAFAHLLSSIGLLVGLAVMSIAGVALGRSEGAWHIEEATR
jgi:hypothetical protein